MPTATSNPFSTEVTEASPLFSQLVGYGTPTTGGKNGQVRVVTNTNKEGPGSLREAVDAGGNAWIVFGTPSNPLQGTIDPTGPGNPSRLEPDSNVTIDGRGSDITILDGGTNQIQIEGPENIIITHLKFSHEFGAGDDSINLASAVGASRFWFHHLSFDTTGDECIGCFRFYDQMTISYCNFYNHKYDGDDYEGKGVLLGGYDTVDTEGYFTLHHNYWDVIQRQPRGRNFRVHQYNDYLYGWEFGKAATAGTNAQIYFENCIGDGTHPDTGGLECLDWWDSADSPPGKTKSVGFHSIGGAFTTERDPDNVFNPYADYSVTPETADATLAAKLQTETGWQDVAHPGTTAPWDN